MRELKTIGGLLRDAEHATSHTWKCTQNINTKFNTKPRYTSIKMRNRIQIPEKYKAYDVFMHGRAKTYVNVLCRLK